MSVHQRFYIDFLPSNISKVPRGLHHFVVKQRITNPTGRYIPVLYLVAADAAGETRLEPSTAVIEFFKDHSSMSMNWMRDVARVCGRFFDYVVQNRGHFENVSAHEPSLNIHSVIAEQFINHLLHGTVGSSKEIAADRTGLFWLPMSPRRVRQLVGVLVKLVDWLAAENHAEVLMKIFSGYTVPRTSSDLMHFLYTSAYQKRVSFLGHLNKQVRRSPKRGIFGTARSSFDAPPRFPEKYVIPLLRDGFGSRSPQEDFDIYAENTVAKICTMLMIAGGLRKSEPLHLYVNDVQFVEHEALIFLHHPQTSIIVDPTLGSQTREYILNMRYQLIPRNLMGDGYHAGWKGMKGDEKGTQIYWLPIPELNLLIAETLRYYVKKVRPVIMRKRREKGLPDHPFLLVGTGKYFNNSWGEIGAPYTLSAFDASWKRAMGRLRNAYADPFLATRKANGTTPHRCRHFYGGYLFRLGTPGERIGLYMHHCSALSHLVYTVPTAEELNNGLNSAARGKGFAMPDNKSLHRTISEALSDLHAGIPWRRK